LSTFFSHSITDSFIARPNKSLYRIIMSHFIWIPFFMIIFTTSIQKKYLPTILTAFLSAIFLSEIISYLIFFQIIDVKKFQELHLLYQLASHLNPTPFMHHIAYSLFLSITALLLIHKLNEYKNNYIRFMIFLFLLSAITNLFLNGGRTGQITFILGLSVYTLYTYKLKIKTLIILSLSIGSIIPIAYFNSQTFNIRVNLAKQDIQKALKGNYNTSWGVRFASNLVTIDYLTSSPQRFLFGAGTGDAKKEYLTHAHKKFSENISKPLPQLHHLHNQYLQYWIDGTIFSLIAILYFFYLLLKLPIKKSNKPLLYTIVIMIMFSLISDILLFRYKPALLILFITSYFIVLSRKEDDVKAL